jgi:hypothetical protein
VIACLLMLSACRDQGPPAPTSQQSEQLNDAEQMLNEMGSKEGPEANAPDPSNQSE